MRITHTGLLPGTPYALQVRSRADGIVSEWSSVKLFVTDQDLTLPQTPTVSSAVFDGATFVAVWNSITKDTEGKDKNIVRYEVELTGNPGNVIARLSVLPGASGETITFSLSAADNKARFGIPKGNISIRVRAVDSYDRISEWSPAVSATKTPPPPVTNLTAEPMSSAVGLRWTEPTSGGVLSYSIHRGDNNSFTPTSANNVGSVSVGSDSFIYTTLTYSEQFFAVVTVDEFGFTSTPVRTSATPIDPFEIDTEPPANPTGVTVTSGFDAEKRQPYLDVSWNANTEDDLADYIIRYATSAAGPWSYVSADRDATSHRIAVQPGTYHIGVRARDYSANGSDFVTASGTPIQTASDTLAPKAPTGLTATPQGGSFIATWNPVTQNTDNSAINDLSHYEVSVTNGGTTVTHLSAEPRFAFSLDMNRMAFTTPKPSVTFRVRAIDLAGNASTWTSNVTATNAVPANVASATAVGGANSITVRWPESADDDIAGYNVYQGTSANPTSKVGFINGTMFGVTLTSTATQHFGIRAVDVFGQESAASALASAAASNPFLVDTTAPAVPSSLAATVTNNPNGIGARASLTWTNGSETDRAGIEVSYKRSTDSVWSSTIFGKDATSGVIELPAAYAAYNFRIRAYDRSANYSAWSSTVNASAPANVAPGNVTGLAGTSTTNSITYRWDALADEDIKGYEITFSTSSTFASGNTTYMAGNTNTLTVSGLNSNTNYYARIRAVDTAGLTSASWSSTNTTKTKTYNSALTDGVAPASSPTPVLTSRIGSIYANWPAVSNADPVTYEVHLSTVSGFTPSAGTMITETPGTFAPIETTPSGAPLSHGVTYYIRLIAKDADGKAPVGAQASGTIKKVTGDDADLSPEDVGAPSTDEFDDLAGKVDTSVKSYVIEYALNSSETVPPTSGWSTVAPTRAPGAFIWTRTVITYHDNTTQTSSPALLTGNTGAQGAPGQDATERYTWVRYADTPTTGMSATPTGKTYMGIAYNKTSATPSSNYSDYSWSLIKGADGSDGKGISNTEVRYAKSAIGDTAPESGWVSSVPTTNPGEFLWTRTVTTYTDSSTSTAYSVAAHGATGPTGSAGRGISGTTVEYAKSTQGTNPATVSGWQSGIPTTNPGEFLWTRTTTTYTSGSPTVSHSVARHGETGQQGVPGPPGEDGQPTYTWIKYAPNGSPTAAQMSDDPAGMTHIGIAHNKSTQVESTTPADYTWALIQGPQGPAGQDGADAPIVTLTATAQALVSPPSGGATTPATATITGSAVNTTIPNNATGWQYSVDGAAFSGTVPAGVSRSGNVVTITGETMTARTIAVKAAGGGTSDTITVAKVSDGAKGDTGDTGAPGSDGRGIASTTIDYAKSSSGTSVPSTGWSTTIPSTSAGQYLWTRTTTNYTSGDPDHAYSVARHGATGAAGRGISSTEIEYAKSTNGTTAPTSGWGTSIPATTTGEFLWTRTITNYTTGSPASDTAYSVSAHGAPGAPGEDAYTVLLTNEAMVFPGTVSAAVAGEETTNVIAYKGGTQVSVTVGTITGQVNGLTTSVTSNNTTSPVIEVKVTTALTAQTGTLNVPITVDGKTFTKRISWSVSRKGATGAQGPKGDDAPVVTVTSTSQALISPATGGATTPATAVVTGSAQNTTITTVEFSVNGSSTWTDSNPTGVTGSGATRTITGANLASSTRTVAVRMKDANGVSDTITIAKVSDGAKGDTGSTGAPGSDGVGVSGTTVTYQVSSNATTPPTGTWHSTVQSTNPGQYLWTRTVTTYTDGSSNIANPAYSVAKHGSTGATGNPGADGRSLTGTTVTYGVSNSGTTQPSSWSETVPSTSPGQFLWTKTTTTYSSAPTSVDSFSVAKHGETGADGKDAYTVLMTNEAMVFAGSTSAALAGSETTSIIAYKGTTQQTATVGTITGQVNGLTTSVTNNGTNAPVITVSVTTALTTQTGVLTVPVTVDGKVFNKTISWSVSRKGATGNTGGTGPQGVSVTAITPYYARVAASASAPTQPTTQATPPSPWTATEPGYLFDTKMYRTDRISYSNGTYSWTTVVESSAYQAAVTAIDTADGKNKIIFSNEPATGTNYKAGDIWYRKSGSDIIGVWEFTTSWQSRTLRDEVLKSLSVGKLASGSISTAAITLASNGKIESQNYDSASSGFRLTSGGIEIKGAPLSIENVGGLRDVIDSNSLTLDGKGKTWFQPHAPRPSSARYAWTGTPGQSESVKLVHGVEVARNRLLNPDPSRSLTHWSRNSLVSADRIEGVGVLITAPADGEVGSTNQVFTSTSNPRIPVSEGDVVTSRFRLTAPADTPRPVAIRPRIVTYRTDDLSTDWYTGGTVWLEPGETKTISVTRTALVGASEFVVSWLGASDQPFGYGDKVIVHDGWTVQVNPSDDTLMFSGDTPGELGADLWVNTADGNKPHRWEPRAPFKERFDTGLHSISTGNTSNFYHETSGGHDGGGRLTTADGTAYLTATSPRVYAREDSPRAEAWVRLEGAATIMAGVVLLETGGSGYRIFLDSRRGSGATASLQIRKGSGTSQTTGASLAESAPEKGQWYRVVGWVDGDTVHGAAYSEAGTLLGTISAVDTEYTSGRSGVYAYGQTSFDEVVITPTLQMGEWVPVQDAAIQAAADAAASAQAAADNAYTRWAPSGVTTIDGGKITTDSLDAIKIKANSTFTQNLNVKSTFTLGDTGTPGVIRSWNYNPASKTGFSLSSSGLEIWQGKINAAALEAGTTITSNLGVSGLLTIGTGGAIESQNYSAASSGFRLTSTGLEVKGAPLSISNVSGLQDTIDLTYSRKGKVWTQDTAPVPTATYEWVGDPHNSPSIKRVNGVEVARNHARNPSVESNIEWRSNHAAQYPTSYSNEVYRSGSRSLSQTWISPGLGLFSLYNVGGPPINVSEFTGSTISHSVWVFSTVPGWARLSARFRNSQTQSYSASIQGSTVELRVGQWTLVSQTIDIPEGVDLCSTGLISQAHETVGDGVYAWADDYMLADGLELPEYFDGDTAEFANDLWIDTANGNKPHRWVNNSWQPAQDEDIANGLRASTHVGVNQPVYNTNSGGFLANGGQGIIIQVDSPVHLGYTTVYAQSAGTISVGLRSGAANGTIVKTKEFSVSAGENKIALDLLLETGTWWLGLLSPSASLWRNNALVSYPYDTGTFRIIGRQANGGSGVLTDNFYYFFYDLEVAGQGVTGAPSSLAYPGKTTINGAVIETGTVSADVISANSTFTQNLNVNSTFTLGSTSTPGVIKSWDYNQANKTGFSLSSAGLEIWQGQINGDAIIANTITSSKIAIGDFTNLVTDPYFEYDRWNIQAGGNIQSINAMPENIGPGKALRFDSTIDTTEEAHALDRFPISPGEPVRASVWVKRLGTGDSGYAALRVRFFDADGSGFAPHFRQVTRSTSNMAHNVWYELVYEGSMPDNAASARMELLIVGVPTENNFYFALPRVRRMNAGELIVDGAIEAKHVDANVFTGKTFYVGSGGTVQSATFNASSGFQLSSTGLIIRSGEVSASTLRAGTLTSDTGVIEVGNGAALVLNGGYIKSNTNTGTTMATAVTSGVGFYLGNDGLFIGGGTNGGKVKANALVSDTLTSTTIKLGSGGVIESDGYTGSGSGFRLTSSGLDIPNGSINVSKVNITNNSIPGGAITSISGDKITTGEIYSRTNGSDGQPLWSIPLTGSATFQNLEIKGNSYLPASANHKIGTVGFTTGGTSGWEIRGDGSAQFNNVTIKGTLSGVGGTFTGTLSGADGTFSGSLTAGKGTITGNLNITSGGKINVNGTSGARIEITHNSINAYATSGSNPVTKIDGTTGKLTTESADITNGVISVGTGSITGDGFTLNSSGLTVTSGTIAAAALNIQVGGNLLPAPYGDFGFASSYYESQTNRANANISINTTSPQISASNQALNVTRTGTSGTAIVRFAPSYNVAGSNLTVTAGKTYIVSAMFRNRTSPTAAVAFGVAWYSSSGTLISAPTSTAFTPTQGSTTWVQQTRTFTAPNNAERAILFVQTTTTTSGANFDITQLQFEEKTGSSNTASPWRPGMGLTTIDGSIIKTGEIRSTGYEEGVTGSGWAIKMSGDAIFTGLKVQGSTVLGSGTGDTTSFLQSSNFNGTNAGWQIRANGQATFYNTLTATNANITGVITATSGTFTGTVNATGGNFTGPVTISNDLTISGNGKINVTTGSITGSGFNLGPSGLFISSGSISAKALNIGTGRNLLNVTHATSNGDGLSQYVAQNAVVSKYTHPVELGSVRVERTTTSGTAAVYLPGSSGAYISVSAGRFYRLSAYVGNHKTYNVAFSFVFQTVNGGAVSTSPITLTPTPEWGFYKRYEAEFYATSDDILFVGISIGTTTSGAGVVFNRVMVEETFKELPSGATAPLPSISPASDSSPWTPPGNVTPARTAAGTVILYTIAGRGDGTVANVDFPENRFTKTPKVTITTRNASTPDYLAIIIGTPDRSGFSAATRRFDGTAGSVFGVWCDWIAVQQDD